MAKHQISLPPGGLPEKVVTLCCLNGCALRQELAHIASMKNVAADKLFTPEGGVILRKPGDGAAGSAVGYAFGAVGRVLSGGQRAAEAFTGAAK